jgi:hypothetical protein
MSEDRSVLYKIRWEILVMALSLILSAVVVTVIPWDFSQKIIEQQKEERRAMQEPPEESLPALNESGTSGPVSQP